MEGGKPTTDQGQSENDKAQKPPNVFAGEPSKELNTKETDGDADAAAHGNPPPNDPVIPPPPIIPPPTPPFAQPHQKWFEKASLTDWIIAVATIVIACVGWFQYQEMSESGTQTDRIIRLYRSQVSQLSRQAGDTHTLAGQAVVQASANKKLAQNAVDTLANTKQSFKDEQRAWVAFQGTGDNKGFTETQPWQIQIVFFNSGRTPARNVQTSGMYKTSPTPISAPSPQEIAMLQFQPAQSIAPQGYYRETVAHAVGPEPINPNQLTGQQILVSEYAQIKSKQLFLYYYGLLKYDDNSGKPHQTQFCIYLADPDTKEVGTCDSFNDLD